VFANGLTLRNPAATPRPFAAEGWARLGRILGEHRLGSPASRCVVPFNSMRLFICHASEDKDSFVRPLAVEMSKHWEVWYDEWTLTLGDSLLQKINEGLSQCDYAVVVFSPSFFSLAKKWTLAELGGLFALERRRRKVILPVLHDFTHEELEQQLPTMSDRIAASSDEGIPKIVKAIRAAVSVSDVTRQIVGATALDRARVMDVELKEGFESDRLLESYHGAKLVEDGTEALMKELHRQLDELSASTEILKFKVTRTRTAAINADGFYRVSLASAVRELCANTAKSARLLARVFLQQPEYLPGHDFETLADLVFRPRFRTGEKLVWCDEKGRTLESAGVIDVIIDALCENVRERAEKRRRQ
jgi:TIR domain